MHRAGLHRPSIDNPRELWEVEEAMAEAIHVESVDDQDASNHNLFPSSEDSNRNLGVDNYPSLQSAGLQYTSQITGYASGYRLNRVHSQHAFP